MSLRPAPGILASLLAVVTLSGCGTESPRAGGQAEESAARPAAEPAGERHVLPEPPTLPLPGETAEEMATEPYDWLIYGGTVVDGTGRAGEALDLLVRGDRIAHLGRVDPDTLKVRERFDAGGLVVVPGFIDAHAHGAPLDDPSFPNFLAMGVTTILLGQDGGSPEAATLDAHLDTVDRARPAVNVAYLVGHNTLRAESGVGFAAPSPDGSSRIAALVARGMDAGAFGLSTGLEYDPGTRADLEELVAIAAPVAARGGIVMSHMRNEDADAVEASVEELLEQGRRSGARVHASHLKVVLGSDVSQANRLLDAMARARLDGVRVTGDVYPYTASFTGLAILFPDWARPPHDYEAVRRTRRGELADHLRARVQARNGPGATLFGSGELPGYGDLTGRTLEEVAREVGRPFEEVLLELGPAGARAAYFVMDEAVMRTFLLDPWIVVSSDGSPTMSHPRGYGSFPLVIRRYVVEERALELEEAIRKMTGLTASILGLDDPGRVRVPRGMLATGWAADIAVFDPTALRDEAAYEAPHRLARGMSGVWVNGRLAWTEEGPGPRAGRALRAR
jgi:N-acyl-D-amino-acid deacylase